MKKFLLPVLSALGCMLIAGAANATCAYRTALFYIIPEDCSAVGDGSTDDTTALQNAINAATNHSGTAYPGTVQLTPGKTYKITSGLTLYDPVTIEGNLGGGGLNDSTCHAGIKVAANNITALTIQGNDTLIHNLCIDAGAYTGMRAVYWKGAVQSVKVMDSQFNHVAVGIEFTGDGATNNYGAVVQRNVVTPIDGNAGGDNVGIKVGKSSTGASTNWFSVVDNLVLCSQSSTSADGMQFYAGSLGFVSGNATSACYVGTRIQPGTNQTFSNMNFNGTILGDRDYSYDLWIDTAASTAQISGLEFTNSFASASLNATTTRISNTSANSGAVINGVHFVQLLSYTHADQNGVDVEYGKDITIDASIICGGGNTTSVNMTADAVELAVRNSRLGFCDHSGSTPQATGININTNSQPYVQIFNNNLRLNTTPISITPYLYGDIRNNLNVDDQWTSVSVNGSSQLEMAVNPFMYYSGTTNITGSTGPKWSSREAFITFTNNSPPTISATNGWCNALTSTKNVIYRMVYDPSSSCWHIGK